MAKKKSVWSGMDQEDAEIGLTLLLLWFIATTLALFFAGTFLGICISTVVLAALSDSLYRQSTITYGVVTMFSRRTGRILREGLHLIWPLRINRVEQIQFDLKTTAISIPIFAQNDVELTLDGSVQWRPASPETLRDDGKPLLFSFLETLGTEITTGLEHAVNDELGTVGGLYPSEKFIQARETLGMIINCVLRLDKLPHLDKKNKKLFPWIPEGETSGINVVADRQRLEFYQQRQDVIREMLDKEGGNLRSSQVEKRYGIDILTFALARVAFSPKVKEAMEKKREAEAKRDAAEAAIEQKVNSMKVLVGEGGLTLSQAHDTSDAVLGSANPRNVTEIRGLEKGGLPIINVGPVQGGN